MVLKKPSYLPTISYLQNHLGVFAMQRVYQSSSLWTWGLGKLNLNAKDGAWDWRERLHSLKEIFHFYGVSTFILVIISHQVLSISEITHGLMCKIIYLSVVISPQVSREISCDACINKFASEIERDDLQGKIKSTAYLYISQGDTESSCTPGKGVNGGGKGCGDRLGSGL